MPLEACKELINKYARPVGFVEQKAATKNNQKPKMPHAFWKSDYAAMLLLLAPAASEAGLSVAKDEGQAWLEQWQDEHYSERLDTYLILALPAEPSDQWRAAVQEAEDDPYVCRKHVIWDDQTRGWQRVMKITPLGLPSLNGDQPQPVESRLTDLQRELIAALEQNGVEKTVERILQEVAQ